MLYAWVFQSGNLMRRHSVVENYRVEYGVKLCLKEFGELFGVS